MRKNVNAAAETAPLAFASSADFLWASAGYKLYLYASRQASGLAWATGGMFMPRHFRLDGFCRKTFVIGAACMAIGLASCGHAAVVAPPVERASDFLEHLGINIHVEYTDSHYVSAADVLKSLRYIGLNLVRDNTLSSYNRGQENYVVLAKAGIHFDMITDGQPPNQIVASLESFELQNPGGVHAIEGLNEINNWKSFNYKGAPDKHAAAAIYQSDIFDAVHSSLVLKSKPVYNFTDYPDHAGRATYAAFHTYPKSSSDCEHGNLARDLDAQKAVMPAAPIVNTEIGAPTLPQKAALDEKSQARFLLMCLFDSSLLGVKELYIYELYDGHDDPGGGNTQAHYGVFGAEPSASGTGRRPKAMAAALHNLTTWLADPTANGAREPVGTFSWARSAVPDGVRTLTLIKANGDVCVVFWRAASVWDGAPIDAAPVSMLLSASAAYKGAKVANLISGEASAVAPSSIAINLGIDPLIVSLTSK